MLVDVNDCCLQLALNYTTPAAVVALNSTATYTTSNSSDAIYTKRQLSRVVGEHCCTFSLHYAADLQS